MNRNSILSRQNYIVFSFRDERGRRFGLGKATSFDWLDRIRAQTRIARCRLLVNYLILITQMTFIVAISKGVFLHMWAAPTALLSSGCVGRVDTISCY